MKCIVATSTTNKNVDVFIQDSSSTTGAGLAGVGPTSLTVVFHVENELVASTTALTAGTLGTWGSSHWASINGTNAPGAYQYGIPNQAIASISLGLSSVFYFKDAGSNNIAPMSLEVQSGLVLTGNTIASVTQPVIPNWAALINPSATNVLSNTTIATASNVATCQFVSSVSSAVLSNVGTVTGVTNTVSVGTVSGVTNTVGATISAAVRGMMADDLLNRNIQGGGAGGARVVRDAFRQLRNRRAISGATMTVYQEDDLAAAWTATISSNSTAVQLTDIDPA